MKPSRVDGGLFLLEMFEDVGDDCRIFIGPNTALSPSGSVRIVQDNVKVITPVKLGISPINFKP
ncbi:MAG: hypothetical protein ACJAUP_000536 [Cellvibrionaceae bacterium]|jgi:hypothetical protein